MIIELQRNFIEMDYGWWWTKLGKKKCQRVTKYKKETKQWYEKVQKLFVSYEIRNGGCKPDYWQKKNYVLKNCWD